MESPREKLLRNDGPRELADQEIKTLLWHSFAFSQGSPFAQRNILRYVSTQYGRQKMDRARQMDILRDCKLGNDEPIGIVPKDSLFFPGKLASKKMHVDLGDRDKIMLPTLRTTMRGYLRSLDTRMPEAALKHLPTAILMSMLYSDYKYVSTRRPRSFSAPKVEDDLFKDPNFSFIVKHLLREESTGIPVYDKMFEDIREAYRGSSRMKPYMTKRICMIAAEYNQSHSRKISREDLLAFCGEDQRDAIDRGLSRAG